MKLNAAPSRFVHTEIVSDFRYSKSHDIFVFGAPTANPDICGSRYVPFYKIRFCFFGWVWHQIKRSCVLTWPKSGQACSLVRPGLARPTWPTWLFKGLELTKSGILSVFKRTTRLPSVRYHPGQIKDCAIANKIVVQRRDFDARLVNR